MGLPATMEDPIQVIDKKSKKSKKAKKSKKEKKDKTSETASKPVTEALTETVEEVEIKEKKVKKDKKDKKKSKEDKKKRTHDDTTDGTPASTDASSSGGRVVEMMTKKAKTESSGGAGRDFYKLASTLENATQAEIKAYRQERTMALENVPVDIRPIRTWDEASDSVDAKLLSYCRQFPSPTPIQAQAWPVCLRGLDMVGVARTGSGKTVAFGVPSMVHIAAQPKLGQRPADRGPIVLVVAPTRELACQINEVYVELGAKVGVKSVCIYGGVPKYEQKNMLKGGAHVIVATPGRLLGLMDEGDLSLKRVSYLILDEADRMLDMGFEPDMRRIVEAIPTANNRQTVMFSATWPKEIRELAGEFMKNPAKVTIGSDDLQATTSVTQVVEVIDRNEKDKKLTALMKKHHNGKNRILIFVLYKKEAPRVERFLQQKGYKCGAVHGDLNQYQRTEAVDKFKDAKQPILVATDVCARGLDIPDVEVVINYSFPLTVEDYVHRIGRTGRGTKSGHAHTFFTINDKTLAGPLCDVLREAGSEVPDALTAFGYAPTKKKEHAMYGAHFKKDDDMPTKAAVKMRFD
ncbi:hypothetical protein SARC_09300 [Sphaeroforma arctica JP610]|uniref:RNA helicase n=1 Tax=Sphaeroforma arctica JP610 TaxID=667725 RepID=A0A0L0FP43_9EUKA|nr:hypothetical protein SARC_09300 [Sphaeroforma arctica JP610]KNC78261.1 hypothetical protein SARC_09300 [Sphaeroforma arctica JP610]|eukprot:XP_014152163.1 hypothetical protein SARC_09300 [Sphaeroforma arctica JP610]